MKNAPMITLIALLVVFSASPLFPQAFGEYGRAVGSVPHGKGITGSPTPGGGKSRGSSAGVGDVGGRKLPTRLVVASAGAGLYARRDDESQKLAELAQGEILAPMVQSAGGNEWYMVKTQSGMIGWIKAGDVREENVAKK